MAGLSNRIESLRGQAKELSDRVQRAAAEADRLRAERQELLDEIDDIQAFLVWKRNRP